MQKEEKLRILHTVDHTCLSVTATWEDIRCLLEEGMRWHTASACLAPLFLRQARAYVQGRLPLCTVIGFPCGYSTTATKVYETQQALEDGADEIDMVIPVGRLREGQMADVAQDIAAVRRACEGHILKVIIETCYLTEEEKIRMCQIVGASGADYIKTSTGFGPGGATPQDVALMAAHCPPTLRIKAAGGIRSFADAQAMLAAGATRLGTSRLVHLMEEETEGGQII